MVRELSRCTCAHQFSPSHDRSHTTRNTVPRQAVFSRTLDWFNSPRIQVERRAIWPKWEVGVKKWPGKFAESQARSRMKGKAYRNQKNLFVWCFVCSIVFYRRLNFILVIASYFSGNLYSLKKIVSKLDNLNFYYYFPLMEVDFFCLVNVGWFSECQ